MILSFEIDFNIIDSRFLTKKPYKIQVRLQVDFGFIIRLCAWKQKMSRCELFTDARTAVVHYDRNCKTLFKNHETFLFPKIAKFELKRNEMYLILGWQ